MDSGGYKALLVFLFLFVFFSRLFFAFDTPYLTENSYYQLRHIEHLQENLIPMYNDPLSYAGRQYYFPPLFHYLMAFIGFFMPLSLAAKIIPNLFFASIIFLVYAISFRITQHHFYSFLGALFFAFTPISYVFPINNLSIHSLAIPLFFGIVYCLTRISEKKYLTTMLLLIVALVFTHPGAFILVLGLLLYFMLLKVEGMKIDGRNTEILLFTMFLVFWTLFIIYKRALLSSGLGAVWQNIPNELLASAFPTLTLFQVIFFVGIVPLFIGAFALYNAVFKKARKPLLLLFGFTLAVGILLWQNFLRLETGLLYLSVLLAILSAEGLRVRSDYMDRTKLHWVRKYTVTFIVLFFVLSSVAPLYSSAKQSVSQMPQEEDIQMLEWLKENTREDSVIIAPLKQGHLVTYFAERRNIADTNFLLIEDVEERFLDLDRIYTVKLTSEALRITDKYKASYIFLSEEAKEIYQIEEIYLAGGCFRKVANTKFYRVGCKLQ